MAVQVRGDDLVATGLETFQAEPTVGVGGRGPPRGHVATLGVDDAVRRRLALGVEDFAGDDAAHAQGKLNALTQLARCEGHRDGRPRRPSDPNGSLG